MRTRVADYIDKVMEESRKESEENSAHFLSNGQVCLLFGRRCV
jgi:protein MPE1